MTGGSRAASKTLVDWPLRFGIFHAPFHPVGQNPTLALHQDLELIQHLDRLGYDEADREATKRSYTLLAREVFPRFQGSAAPLTRSRDWAVANRPEFITAAGAAIGEAMQRHQAEREQATAAD